MKHTRLAAASFAAVLSPLAQAAGTTCDFSDTGTDRCGESAAILIPVGDVGSPLTVTICDDNSGATADACGGVRWWETIMTDQCADLTISLCGTDPVQDPSFLRIFDDCTCSGFVSPTTSGRGAPVCSDNNIWMYFRAFPPGTFYIPVQANPNVLQSPPGPFVLNITAEACTGACCDEQEGVCIDQVVENDCNGPGQTWAAGSTCCGLQCGDTPGDVITRDLPNIMQIGRDGPVGSGTVGIAIGTTACNVGIAELNWFALPDTDHPLITTNLYRLKNVDGSDRFEQIGLSWIKHAFLTINEDKCGENCRCGCTGLDCPGDRLVRGCADVYGAVLFDNCNLFTSFPLLGPRSAVNPYTGEMPVGANLGAGGGCDTNYPAANHIGHAHTPVSHRIQVQDTDLAPALNAGSRYFGQGQYISAHEFRSGANLYNNVSYREVGVGAPDAAGEYGLTFVGETITELAAIHAWPGATVIPIESYPVDDGRAFLAYAVTDLGGGQWHYEYALYNMNRHRAHNSFSVPIPSGVVISNIGFFAPRQHPPELHAENYSNDPWTVSTDGGAISWSTDSFETDPLANAVRYATTVNFRFDADAPPRTVNATVGLFRSGSDMTVATSAPRAPGPQDCNNNGLEDTCDLDCTASGCTVSGCGESEDCDATGVPDECEVDCNENGVADSCDIDLQTSPDVNDNGIPDDCELALFAPDPLESAPNPFEIPRGSDLNRTGGFAMPVSAVAGGQEVAIRIRLMELYVDTNEDPVNGCPVGADFSPFENQVRYLGSPSAFDDNDIVSTPQFVAAELQCTPYFRDWSSPALTAEFGAGVDTGTIYFYGAEVLPCSVYEAQQGTQACVESANPEDCFSTALQIRTALWGDVWPPFGVVSFTDIGKIVDAFKSIPFVPGDPPTGAPRKVQAMLRENSAPLDSTISFTDIGNDVDAFKTITYAEDGPTACP